MLRVGGGGWVGQAGLTNEVPAGFQGIGAKPLPGVGRGAASNGGAGGGSLKEKKRERGGRGGGDERGRKR